LGAKDVEVARFLPVDPSTIYLWRIQHPEFSESMKIGKALPDDRVERSLYQRACGYEVEVKKTVIKKGRSRCRHNHDRVQRAYPRRCHGSDPLAHQS
jgi:hypothetical protein